MRRLLKKQGGFTLLELLIIVVIVGILAILIIPNLISGPQRARDAERKKDLRNLKTYLETYFNDNNSYPSAATWEAGLTQGPTPYVSAKNWPKDPKSNTNYVYVPSPAGCDNGACVSYTLTATMENSKDAQASNGAYTVESAN